MQKKYWLERATAKIRFKEDKEAVRRELEWHILDREEAYLAKGLEPYEAARSAVTDMGDPEELAVELARVHTPWWGRLWRLSKTALVIAVILFLIQGIPELKELWEYRSEPYRPTLPEKVETWTYAENTTRTIHRLEDWEFTGSTQLGQYRFTAPMAWLTYSEPWTDSLGEDHDGSYELTVVLRAQTWKLWERSSGDQFMILDNQATDENGTIYARWMGNQAHESTLFCYTHRGGPGVTWYELYFDLPSGEAPQRLEIPVGYGGASLTLDFTGEEVS